jgi:hypothetical protein
MRHEDHPRFHNFDPLTRWLLIGLIILLSVAVFHAIESYISASHWNRSHEGSNPFPSQGPVPSQLRNQILTVLQQSALQPSGYVASLSKVDEQVIQLEVHQLTWSEGPLAARQRQTTYDLCQQLARIYERSSLDPAYYPQQIDLLFDPRLEALPTYRTTILFEDALSYWQGTLSDFDFEARWVESM